MMDRLRVQVDVLYESWLAHGYNDFRTQELFNKLLQIRNEEQLYGQDQRDVRAVGSNTDSIQYPPTV